MPATFHLVRHAQGFHNLSVANESIVDPLLTDLGKQQCADLKAAFADHDKLTHLIASPMRRTLYTCLLGFGAEPPKNLKVLAIPELQEVSDAPCDTGSDVAVLQKEFGDKVDFSRVGEDWNVKTPESPWEPTLDKLAVRARDSRLILREIAKSAPEDAHIAVVSHGGFLHFMTNEWDGILPNRATAWENTEYRSFQFVDQTGEDADALMKEVPASWKRRRGSTVPLSKEEQEDLRRMYYRMLEPYLKYSNHH